MCFVWSSEQREIISLYSINSLVFINEAECLLRGTKWIFKSDRYSFVLKGLKHKHHGEFLYVHFSAYFTCETDKRILTKRDIGSL